MLFHTKLFNTLDELLSGDPTDSVEDKFSLFFGQQDLQTLETDIIDFISRPNATVVLQTYRRHREKAKLLRNLIIEVEKCRLVSSPEE